MGQEKSPQIDWDAIRREASAHAELPIDEQLKIVVGNETRNTERLERAR